MIILRKVMVLDTSLLARLGAGGGKSGGDEWSRFICW